ncbi:hypothetical protein CC2G_003239 [Coprinopsis cinerea AmutBmut pab1-1]|nr:hypothetical protein CC2G_003239 [Coprinopsis cinerea AmutBmut pab1-1]
MISFLGEVSLVDSAMSFLRCPPFMVVPPRGHSYVLGTPGPREVGCSHPTRGDVGAPLHRTFDSQGLTASYPRSFDVGKAGHSRPEESSEQLGTGEACPHSRSLVVAVVAQRSFV